MSPAYKPGQLVVVLCRDNSKYTNGQVVMLRHNGLEKVKRIIEVRGSLIWVEGDNASDSTDSRHFGWLNIDAVLGNVYPKRLLKK